MKERIVLCFMNSCINKYLLAIFIYCTLVASVIAQEAGNQDIDQILNGIEKRYSKKEFIVDFSQVSKLKALDIDEAASGKALFSHPGKMIWEYLEPQQHKMIMNGKTLWFYRPDQNQVMVWRTQNFFRKGSGGALLSDISIIRKNYIIAIKNQRGNVFELFLVPKTKIPEIQSLLMIVSEKDYNIQKIITTNVYEDTIEIRFRNIEFKDIDDSVFEFTIPASASIIDLDNKQIIQEDNQ